MQLLSGGLASIIPPNSKAKRELHLHPALWRTYSLTCLIFMLKIISFFFKFINTCVHCVILFTFLEGSWGTYIAHLNSFFHPHSLPSLHPHLDPLLFFFRMCLQYVMFAFLVWSLYMYMTHPNFFFSSFPSLTFLHFLIPFLFENNLFPYFLLSIIYFVLYFCSKFLCNMILTTG